MQEIYQIMEMEETVTFGEIENTMEQYNIDNLLHSWRELGHSRRILRPNYIEKRCFCIT